MAEAEQPAAGAQPGTFVDPYRNYNFKIEVRDVGEGHFTQCSGMGVKVADIKYREGGLSQVVHRLPGPVDYADIELKYGLTSSMGLWNWFMASVQGRVERRNVTISLLGSNGVEPVLKWDLENAWPSQWRGALLDAMGREAAIESLTLVFETLQRG